MTVLHCCGVHAKPPMIDEVTYARIVPSTSAILGPIALPFEHLHHHSNRVCACGTEPPLLGLRSVRSSPCGYENKTWPLSDERPPAAEAQQSGDLPRTAQGWLQAMCS